jgi:uncharacterized protein (TIGR02246 family)
MEETMRKVLLTCAFFVSVPMAALAGPKEDAFQVIEQFKKAFDSSDVPGVVKLFAPDAVFLGTVSPKLATKTADIDAYFQGIKVDTPRSIVLGEFSTLVLSDSAVVFAGMDTFSSTRDGKKTERPARFTFVVTNGSSGWRISHFHSSWLPGQ